MTIAFNFNLGKNFKDIVVLPWRHNERPIDLPTNHCVVLLANTRQITLAGTYLVNFFRLLFPDIICEFISIENIVLKTFLPLKNT